MAVAHVTRRDVGAAAGAALGFLLSARDRGWWRDFDIAGASTMWVTGYVGSVVATLDGAPARHAAWSAWRRLRRARWWASGWGYAAWVPADADSTAWALRLAQALGVRRSLWVKRGYAFLTRHLHPCGGLSTYASSARIRHFTRLATDFGGWCAPHTCVTAAAAQLRGLGVRSALIAHLRQRQRPDGSWSGYWWYDPEYTTALSVEAIAGELRPGDDLRLSRAVRWASARIGSDGAVHSAIEPTGSAFATACAVRILTHRCEGPDATIARDARRHAVDWLLATQRPDGSWPASARLRVPPPDLADPELLTRWGRDGRGAGSIGTIVLDRGRVFTTASVLSALALIAGWNEDPPRDSGVPVAAPG